MDYKKLQFTFLLLFLSQVLIKMKFVLLHIDWKGAELEL